LLPVVCGAGQQGWAATLLSTRNQIMLRRGLTSSGVSSITSPSYTSLFSLMRRPIARRKFSMRISTFFTSVEYTSEPTMGTKGTLGPNSLAMPSAMAVLPVPGAPANSRSINASAEYLQTDATIDAAVSVKRKLTPSQCRITNLQKAQRGQPFFLS